MAGGAGIAIDTFANEATEGNFEREFIKLTEGRNLIITPHIGGATFTSMMRTEEFIAEKLCEIASKKHTNIF